MSTVTVKKGFYRGTKIKNAKFELVRPWKDGVGGGFITIYNDGEHKDLPTGQLRIKCDKKDQDSVEIAKTPKNTEPELQFDEPIRNETDEQIKDRLRERFSHLEEMSRAASKGIIRGLVVCGAPGTGKSHGVTSALERDNVMAKLADREPNYGIVKGHVTPTGLYRSLFERAEAKQVLIFDDCDSVLEDQTSLNLLKAALDSTDKRIISWNSEGHFLNTNDLPNRFEFKGSVIFITNMNFERIVEAGKSKLAPHLEAIVSRCHVLDLTMDTYRDKFLRIEQVIQDFDMLGQQCLLDKPESEEVIDFMRKHGSKLREMSLRMAIKIADLRKVDAKNWKRLAQITCMKRAFVNSTLE